MHESIPPEVKFATLAHLNKTIHMILNDNFISPILLTLTLFMIGCANDAGNGISADFKENYLQECKKQAEVNVSTSAAAEYCNCTLGIIIGKFDNDQAAEHWVNNLTMSDLQEFVAPCVN